MKPIRTFALAIVSAMMFLPVASISATDPTTDAIASVETYIVRFTEAGLLYYTGGTENFAATAPDALGSRKLNSRTPEARAYTDHLTNLQNQRLASIEGLLQRQVPMRHTYTVMFNGVALDLSADEAAQLRNLPNISSVDKAGVYEIDTDTGPTLIGAPGVWSGASMPSGLPNRGENVVIGVLDGGANSDHPSFANDASCGFSVGVPKQISAVDCSVALCAGPQPEDTGTTGHGVHTSSTAGGNHLVPPLTVAGVQLRWEISGVAPCARIRHYKVCPTNSCPGADILAGIQAAITDQVDVVNFSISGGSSPWTDNDRGFLDMVNADIFVSASAGNTSATITNPVGAVNHRGPWVMSVANSTHSRVEGNEIDVAGGPQDVASQVGTGPAYAATTTSQVAVASTLGNELGCNPGFTAGSMTGRIALISRGTCGFAEKVTNATNAGAIGAVVYNNVGGPPILMGALEPTTIPSVMIGNTAGIAVRDFLTNNPTAAMTITAPAVRLVDPAFADVLNSSSLRGPNDSFDVTKPDITGPGTNIYAAVSDAGGQFGFLTGTSMSAPHVAGAGTLVRSAQPSWTPQEVKSAMQLTSKRDGLNSTGLAPWNADDIGNGRVDVGAAVRTGLVMNETFANFLAANPATGGQPRTLNIPSLRHTSCAGSCTFTRTFRNTKATPTTWNAVVSDAPAGTQITVSPASFSFTGNLAETQTVTITVAITALPPGITATSFGHLIFRDAAATLPDARLSVAIRGSSDTLFRNGFE
jgi:subtilisin family serine protease